MPMVEGLNGSRSGAWQYALFAIPLAFAGIPIYILAPDYYATSGGLSLTALGSSLLILRLLDAVLDPLIGSIGDHLSGLRYGFLATGVFILVVGFSMLFSPFGLDSLAWFSISIFLVTLGYSIASIQFNSMAALWSKNTNSQIKITTWREGFGLIGLLIAVGLPGIFGVKPESNTVYFALVLVLIAMLIVSLPALSNWYRSNRDSLTTTSGQKRPFSNLSDWPWLFFLTYGLSALASAIPAVLVIFFIRDRLDLGTMIGPFLALYFISALVGLSFWRKVALRRGHLVAWRLAMVVGVLGFFWAFWLDGGDALPYAIICIFSGAALGGELSLPPALLSQTIHNQNSGEMTGRYFAIFSLLTKLALAVAAGLTLPLLDFVGFRPGEQNDSASLVAVSAAYALLPCMIKVAAFLSSYWWQFSGRGLNEEKYFNLWSDNHYVSDER